MIKTLVLSTLLLVSLQAEAKMCKWLDEEGNWNFSFVNDKPTKTISGTVSTMALCPEPPPVKVTKIIYEEYIEPNPINACQRSAQLACDPSFGGLPIGDLSEVPECGYVLVSTQDQINAQGGVVRYLHGAPYSGLKVDPNRNQFCPK
jgi:hypothetical protein